jgi:hypothetical protein
MKATRSFSPALAIEAARSGALAGEDLRRTILMATEFGNLEAAGELQLCVVHASRFAGDAAPAGMLERMAQGLSALKAMGHRLNPTVATLRKLGVVKFLDGIAGNPHSNGDFERLRAGGFERLTAEAIVLDYPELFGKETTALARQRLGR